MESDVPYKIYDKIDNGCMSTVYRGYNTIHKCPVAIKIYNILTPRVIKTAAKEADLMRRLNSINSRYFPRCYDAGYLQMSDDSENGDYDYTLTRPYLIMELGQSIFNYANTIGIISQKINDDKLSKRSIFRKMAYAVYIMHSQGIVHSDIKLENFIITNDGNVKLIDFAGALKMPLNQTMIPGKSSGTEGLMPPEKTTSAPIEGYATDIYCLGNALCEMTFGYVLKLENNIVRRTLLSLHPDHDLTDLLSKMICSNPFERYTIIQVINSAYLQESNKI
ncbi:hypothetical protein GJ496_005152 [Pomphorhynchus laevis]|nr:hypothetical protein GJ496_005152 [Pomphorhynchus laevis]